MTIAIDKKQLLPTLTTSPGVYQMLAADGSVLYVGKARNLKNRVSSYFQQQHASRKTEALMAHVCDVQVIITESETEALILENTLIKKFKPRFNVLFRDDKSYPYIYMNTMHDFPRIDLYRGKKQAKGSYFGPYPSVTAVRETLGLLQKLFRVRQCSDVFYANRSRPCLQHQIKRCRAPCVGLIDKQSYQQDVEHTLMFLQGKDQQVIDELAERMEQASAGHHYETAAVYRDQIASLRHVQEQQYVSKTRGDIDVVGFASDAACCCVQLILVRGGRVLGSQVFFPKLPTGFSDTEALQAFMVQHYLAKQGKEIVKEIVLSFGFDDIGTVQTALSEHAGKQIKLTYQVRGERARWLHMAKRNAEHSLAQRLSSRINMQQRFSLLQETLALTVVPSRIECFDISHSSGEGTVASCVVFDSQGSVKRDYRRFNITDITPGDDYAAMYQALHRRYSKLKGHPEKLPELLLIDGGKGQLGQAQSILDELALTDKILAVGIAKGTTRKPGLEHLIVSKELKTIHLGSDNLALHLLQQIRDEAHRFAIAGHRQRRAKKRNTSVLEGIAGVGPKKRRELLRHFGGLQGISGASVEELAKVSGINAQLAQRIFSALH